MGVATDTYCGDCEEPIFNEDSANRLPCPKCGSKKRKYHLSMGVTVSVSVSADAQVVSYPQSFLGTARDWIREDVEELYSMAVIVCHVACEVATERAMDAAFRTLGNELLEKVIRKRIRSNRMGTEETRKLYTALTGDGHVRQCGVWIGTIFVRVQATSCSTNTSSP
jgi:hypothetical protein